MARIPPDAIFLPPDNGQTLQSRLAAGVVRAILQSRAPVGATIPSTRALAARLGISRMTVTLVYQELAAQGYIEPRPRSGFCVAQSVPHRRITPPTAPEQSRVNWDEWLNPSRPRKRVIEKPANWRDYRFPFIYGQADPRLFNHSAWRDCARRAMGTRDFSTLAADQHSQDDPMLVDYICSNTLVRRGINAAPDQVLVTLGAQNALYIAVELLARANRPAVMEEPGYPDFAELLRRSPSPVRFAAVDDGGLNPADLPAGTRLVMVAPSHNIPSGTTMPLDRRQALLARAEAEDFLIIEDDYDFEMSYLEPPAPALKSLDQGGRVIYVGSFSKSLFPGLRIGYMVGPPAFIAQARVMRAMILRHAPSHLQRITAYFLALGHYDSHIVRLRETLARRRRALVSALDGTPLTIAGAARQGGSSLWIKAPDGIDSRRLAAGLVRDSVLIEPGDVFFEHPPAPCPFFRMGYASISADDIAQGVGHILDHIRTFGQ